MAEISDIQGRHCVYNSWAVGYVETLRYGRVKIFEYPPETISNRHLQVDFVAFSTIL